MRLILAKANVPLLILGVSAGALGFAFFSQFALGLNPCVLCIYQRWPFVVAAALAALLWFLRRHPLAVSALLAGLAASFAVNSGIAIFHVGVEQSWWQGLSGCTSDLSGATSIEDLKRRVLGAPVVRCSDIAWSLFGISMAGYNVLLSFLLAGYCGWQLLRKEPAR